MFPVEFFSSRMAFALVAAGGYAIATLLMKLMAENGFALTPVLGIGLIFVATVMAEVFLMRQVDLGIAYIVVVGVETLLVLGAAYYIGEGLSARELLGGAFVVAGMTMVSL